MKKKNIKSIVIILSSVVLWFTMVKPAESNIPGWTISGSTHVLGLRESINLAWILMSAFLVFNMQTGFAFLGAGFLRKKNTLNYLSMSFMDLCVGGFFFWGFGFALMYGGSNIASGLDSGNSLIGYSGFFLSGDAYHPSTSSIWLFQVMFAVASCAIVAGAVAERFKFQAHLAYSGFICGILYPVFGHWVWGGGWLANLPFGSGVKDFAGSGVVHGLGGIVALVGSWMAGPRFGKYNPNGTPNGFPGHNLTYVVIGTLILMFGWFGFNAGSSLAVTEFRVAIIAVNTLLSAISAAFAILLITYFRTGVSDITLTCNGALAGCVAITASGAYVPHWAAVVIGIIAALVLRSCLYYVEFKLRIDDPIGAISVHGANGLWGLLSVGIFADGSYMDVKGLIVGSGGQLLSQFIGCLVLIVWTVTLSYLMFYILSKTIGLRVPIKIESSGIDLYEHGMSCYHED